MHDKLTREDIARMQEELDHRILVVRKEALEAVKEARAQGDLSENFEYKAAKQYKNQNESRIRYLERMIRSAVIVEDHTAADEVGLNKRVRVKFTDDGEEDTFIIVTSIRGNSMKGYITPESPAGKALMGHKAGETVQVALDGGGGYGLEILSVETVENADEIAIRKF